MLSFGIRFGEGFDRPTLIKLMGNIPAERDYEFLVIGTDPGGVACAKEASLAGKKTALVKWRHFTPVEKEINFTFEEKAEIAKVEILGQKSVSSSDSVTTNLETKVKLTTASSRGQTPERVNIASKTRVKKIRKTNIDYVNELFKRDQQARKLMHNVGNLQRVLQDAHNSGWRIGSVNHRPSLNWIKMMDQVTDFVMEENWKVVKELGIDIIEVNEGSVHFIDGHSIEVDLVDIGQHVISADLICLAIQAEYKFPEDVVGATEFGIDCNDFVRMIQPPGKTLVVGGRPESLECAGILACCKIPVTVVSRSDILKGYDKGMGSEIKEELKNLGVKFLENTSLKSIEPMKTGQLLATYEYELFSNENGESGTPEKEAKTEEFETVLFAVGTQTDLTYLNLNEARVEYNLETQKIYTDKDDLTRAPNIYAIGDAVAYHPQGFEISELSGKLLGKRLFQQGTETIDYAMAPVVMFTPTEYAFIGLSEDAAMYRFGPSCIGVYQSYFRPLEYVIPRIKAQCLIKLIVFTAKDLIIGLHLYGPEAGEAIQGFAAAFKFGLTMSKLGTVIGVHGTKSQNIVKLTELKNPS